MKFKALKRFDKQARRALLEMAQLGTGVYSVFRRKEDGTPLCAAVLVFGDGTEEIMDAVERVRGNQGKPKP